MDALFITSFASFGDIIYQTPFIRFLNNVYDNVDVWCRNHEPLLNNPYIRDLYKLDSFDCPSGQDFYFKNVFKCTKDQVQIFYQSNIHTVDFFSLAASRIVLRDKEKHLDLFWTKRDEESVCEILAQHQLVPNVDLDKANFTVICPSVTWASRTLPLEWYQELIHLIQTVAGDKVVIVGKELAYDEYDPKKEKSNPDYDKMRIDEKKLLHPVSAFPGVVDLTNQLTLQQVAALYHFTKIAINSENGNMVMSCTNNNCWNLYIPTLTAPEFRTPYRLGDMLYKTVVVGNDEDYYPASHYSTDGMGSLKNVAVKIPTPRKVLEHYLLANRSFKRGITKLY